MSIQPQTPGKPRHALIVFIIAITALIFAPRDASADDLDAVVGALEQAARAPLPVDPVLKFPQTINPDEFLLLQLQNVFGRYFSKEINLIPLLTRIVVELAVVKISDTDQILYNPSRQLFLYISSNSPAKPQVRIATLSEVAAKLGKAPLPSSPLSGYSRGFEEFDALAQLLRDPDTRETLRIIWQDAPRSDDDKKEIQLLLLTPLQQAIGIGSQSNSCKGAIDHFVEDVRAGKDSTIRPVPGLSNIVRPSNYFQGKNEIFLVLSEAVIARYYVFAEFKISVATCDVTWRRSFFVM